MDTTKNFEMLPWTVTAIGTNDLDGANQQLSNLFDRVVSDKKSTGSFSSSYDQFLRQAESFSKISHSPEEVAGLRAHYVTAQRKVAWAQRDRDIRKQRLNKKYREEFTYGPKEPFQTYLLNDPICMDAEQRLNFATLDLERTRTLLYGENAEALFRMKESMDLAQADTSQTTMNMAAGGRFVPGWSLIGINSVKSDIKTINGNQKDSDGQFADYLAEKEKNAATAATADTSATADTTATTATTATAVPASAPTIGNGTEVPLAAKSRVPPALKLRKRQDGSDGKEEKKGPLPDSPLDGPAPVLDELSPFAGEYRFYRRLKAKDYKALAVSYGVSFNVPIIPYVSIHASLDAKHTSMSLHGEELEIEIKWAAMRVVDVFPKGWWKPNFGIASTLLGPDNAIKTSIRSRFSRSRGEKDQLKRLVQAYFGPGKPLSKIYTRVILGYKPSITLKTNEFDQKKVKTWAESSSGACLMDIVCADSNPKAGRETGGVSVSDRGISVTPETDQPYIIARTWEEFTM